ncbi:nucleotide disphospho-sugar-binding domain-containing protein [Kineococcus sp. SYSU DK003]|uniref:nucleotide disphospho-sugar-binding domain-containing protein n=1 Tax=Kineococcus sp. SYSU DK003 TaxID=3383124 RepID=UPI003D7CDE5B
MHVLAALWDGGGTVPAELGVVRRLRERGHSVTVLADPPLELGATRMGAGYRCWVRAPFRRSDARQDDYFRDWECRTPLGQFARVRDRLITGPAAAFAADVREQLAAEPADAAVVSSVLLGALAGTESQGVPTAALCPNIYTRPTPGLPPLGLGLRQARGPVGRARDAALDEVLSRLWNGGLGDLNTARAHVGLPPLKDVWQQWDHTARVLVLTDPDFDLPARLPANVRYTGAVLDDPPWVQPYQPPPGDAPLVVANFSSTFMKGQEEVLRRVVAALGSLPVRAVVTTGPAVDPAGFAGAPGVDVVRSAPHTQLFPQAAVVITHAGHGTLLKALAAGVPVLCLPMGRDQYDNVVRATRHGAALGLRRSAPPGEIAAGVRRLLHDPSFGRAACGLGEGIRARATCPALIDELEALPRHVRRTI